MFPSIPNPNFKLHVGWRNIKTSITAMLVAIVYCLIGRNPAFACIGVIFGLGYDMEDSIKNGGNRLFGTLIGGLLSIVVFRFYLIFFPQGGHTVFLAVLLGFAIVILILLCSYFWPGGVQRGALHRAVQHPCGQLHPLRAQPHSGYIRRRHRGTGGELFSPP